MYKIVLVIAMLSNGMYIEAEMETEQSFNTLTECKEEKAKTIEKIKHMEMVHKLISDDCVKVSDEITI